MVRGFEGDEEVPMTERSGLAIARRLRNIEEKEQGLWRAEKLELKRVLHISAAAMVVGLMVYKEAHCRCKKLYDGL